MLPLSLKMKQLHDNKTLVMLWLCPFIHETQVTGNALEDLGVDGHPGIVTLQGPGARFGHSSKTNGSYSGQLRGTFMRKKYFLQEGLPVISPLCGCCGSAD